MPTDKSPPAGMNRSRTLRRVVGGGIVVVLAGLGLYVAVTPVDAGSVTLRSAGDEVMITDFGLRRVVLNRSFDVPLCRPSFSDLHLPECAARAAAASSPTAPTRLSRPDVVSVRPFGDLRQVSSSAPFEKNGDCNLSARGSQFPADQVKATAQNEGTTDLIVTLSAVPNQPETVRPGTYCGYLEVARSNGNDIELQFLASLSDRGQESLRARVFLTLLFGALIGAALKWMGDSYAPVAGLRRRERRLVRRFGDNVRYLPEHAQYDLAVIEDGIGSFEPEDLDGRLGELEQQGDALAQFGAALRELEGLIAEQGRLADTISASAGSAPGWDPHPSVAEVRAAEYASAQRLLAQTFPWKASGDTATAASELRDAARLITAALDARDTVGYQDAARGVISSVGGKEPDDAVVLPHADSQRDLSLAVEPIRVAQAEHRTVAEFLLDNVLIITMIIGAVVVALVGFQTQFMNDVSFDGGEGSYLKLFAWAFTVQLAGVTVLEVAGKLLTPSPARPAHSDK